MTKKRTNVMQDDPIVVIYLVVVCAALMALGASMMS